MFFPSRQKIGSKDCVFFSFRQKNEFIPSKDCFIPSKNRLPFFIAIKNKISHNNLSIDTDFDFFAMYMYAKYK